MKKLINRVEDIITEVNHGLLLAHRVTPQY